MRYQILTFSASAILVSLVFICSLHETPELSPSSNFLAKVSHTGHVEWAPSVRLTTACSVDLTYFPADKQRCNIELTYWAYNTDTLKISFPGQLSEAVIAENFGTDGEWVLEGTNLWQTVVLGTDDASYPILGVTLYLKRHSRFYILNVVVPFLALGMLASMVFLIPPDTGERISFGISAMVSFTVLFMFILELMPSSGDITPILGKYYHTFCIINTFHILQITINIIHSIRMSGQLN